MWCITMDYSQLARKPSRQITKSPETISPDYQLARNWSTRQKAVVKSPDSLSQVAR